MPAISAWRSESSPSVAETSVRVDLLELDGQGAGLEDEREILRLLDRVEAGDLGACRPRSRPGAAR